MEQSFESKPAKRINWDLVRLGNSFNRQRAVDVRERLIPALKVLDPDLDAQAGWIDCQQNDVAATAVGQVGNGLYLGSERTVNEPLVFERSPQSRAAIGAIGIERLQPLVADRQVVDALGQVGIKRHGADRGPYSDRPPRGRRGQC